MDHRKDIYFTLARPPTLIFFPYHNLKSIKKKSDFSFVVLNSGRFRFLNCKRNKAYVHCYLLLCFKIFYICLHVHMHMCVSAKVIAHCLLLSCEPGGWNLGHQAW